MAKEKPNKNVVFVVHVDAGKSTCVGRYCLMWNGSEQYMAKLRSESETLKSRF
jgi:translation elongation factor EF-1alpha